MVELETKCCSTTANDKNVLDHVFDGWSIWLEPDLLSCENQWFQKESEELCVECGGIQSGLVPVPLHCTLLYNFAPLLHANEKQLQQLLHRCIIKDDIIYNNDLVPTDFYFFHYPKSADDGKGFGCVIPLLLFECTSQLEQLYLTVQSHFPPHERSNHTKFQPHMALIYAPEVYHDYIQTKIKQYKINQKSLLQKPIRVKYLSIWDTRGTLSQWKCITKIPLYE